MNDICAADFETTGLHPWHGHTITHLSLAFYSPTTKKSWCRVYTDHQEMKEALLGLINASCDIIWYNSCFDLHFIYRTWPELYLDVHSRSFDCMRLRQMQEAPELPLTYGLKDAVKTFLPDVKDYTAPLKQWVISHNKTGDFRQYLTEMPQEVVAQYVAEDAMNTLKLWLKLSTRVPTSWRDDHTLFMFMVDQFIKATDRGILVDRLNLIEYITEVQKDIEHHIDAFKIQHADGISQVEEAMWETEKSKRKTEKGKAGVPRPSFNVGSNTQLAKLFVEVYKQTPTIFTEKNSPSFKAAHLDQWEGMEELKTVGKRELVLNQAKSLLEFSEKDGRWHQQLKASGTITGRFAGSGGLNIQALARRDKGLMSCLIAPECHSFISIDSNSCEPSIISEYSKDKLYTKIIFGMKGVKPYWENNILILDDIYLSFLSACSFGKKIMQDTWQREWPCGSFEEQWVIDSDVIKQFLKKPRAVAKMSVLAISYSAGAAKIFIAVSEAGFKLDKKDASNMVATYKKMFQGITIFSENCATEWEENNGRVTNYFGYSAVVSSGHKAANFMIQSSVNPIMIYFLKSILKYSPYATYITTIHDEIIFLVPDEKITDFKHARDLATVEVNKWLNWATVSMGFGFAVGKNLYEAK